MRLAIMSDVHGNLTALEAVLADIAGQGPFDALGVAGDLCEWGPRPREALARVRELGCPVVQGNTDRNVITTDEAQLRALGKSAHSIEAWPGPARSLAPPAQSTWRLYPSRIPIPVPVEVETWTR